MRRGKPKRQMHLTTRSHQVRRKTLVIFHIARAKPRLVAALKFIEYVCGILTHQVDQQVNTATMRHTDDGFYNTRRTGTVNQFCDTGNERLCTFKTESLCTGVFGTEILPKAFSCNQPVKNSSFYAITKGKFGSRVFHALLYPHLFRFIRDVHVFNTDRTAVSALEHIDDFP